MILCMAGVPFFPMRGCHREAGGYTSMNEINFVNNDGYKCGEFYDAFGHYTAYAYLEPFGWVRGYGRGQDFLTQDQAVAYVHRYCKE